MFDINEIEYTVLYTQHVMSVRYVHGVGNVFVPPPPCAGEQGEWGPQCPGEYTYRFY